MKTLKKAGKDSAIDNMETRNLGEKTDLCKLEQFMFGKSQEKDGVL